MKIIRLKTRLVGKLSGFLRSKPIRWVKLKSIPFGSYLYDPQDYRLHLAVLIKTIDLDYVCIT